ncbi:T9SS type A sorting domain-containing protein [candidate division KSB1 bacterium]|nr:T9SS type A sorting domain-containing protein [candidate division KSB1 bacterium]
MKTRLLFCMVLFLSVFWGMQANAQGHSESFVIAGLLSGEGWPQAAYNPISDEYLVVWEDYRNGRSDIYGQFVNADGTLRGENIPIVTAKGNQYWPHLDFDPILHQFLIVYENWTEDKHGDIRGIFLKADGSFGEAPTSDEEDHTFGICTHPGDIYTCSVAFNFREHVYLVVWGDGRYAGEQGFSKFDVFGQLVAADGTLLPPPDPADPEKNFIIAGNPDYAENVADVTYSHITNEFFVVWGTSVGYVHGQRINHLGQHVLADGTILGLLKTGDPSMRISDEFDNSPDSFQARVQANVKYSQSQEGWCECEVVWKGRHIPDGKDNDIWGQRIGFFKEGEKFVAKYVDLDGNTTSVAKYAEQNSLMNFARSNHAISLQTGSVNAPEIAYGAQDNEFLVAWGDARDHGYGSQDVYCQRLAVQDDHHKMLFLADDRVNTVTNKENIPLAATEGLYQGSLIGIAHNSAHNQFLVVYTFNDPKQSNEPDLKGITVYGSPPTAVEEDKSIPGGPYLGANYPNPFNQETQLDFLLQQPEHIVISVYDLLGREIITLFNGIKPAGQHRMSWNGKDTQGNDMATGIYFLTLRYQSNVLMQKVALVR